MNISKLLLVTAFTVATMAGSHQLRAMETQGSEDREITIDKLKGLAKQVKNGTHFVQATETAQLDMQNNDKGVQHFAFTLFKELFEQKHAPAFDTALQAAQLAMKSNSRQDQAWARILFNELVKNKYDTAFAAATQAAQKGMQINDKPVLMYSLAIFKMLFKYEYAPAFEAADQAVKQAEKDHLWQFQASQGGMVNYWELQNTADKLEEKLYNARQK